MKNLINISTIKNSALVDFNDENLDNVRLLKVNILSVIGEQLRAELYVDNVLFNSVDESSFLKLDADETRWTGFYNWKLFLTSPNTLIEIPTKAYADSLTENDRNRRD